jgi:hypothetical protein
VSGNAAGDPFEAGNVLSHEKEITMACTMLLCYVTRWKGRSGYIFADSFQKFVVLV